MVKVIETNLSIGNYDEILDHQSRVIEVDSWESYVEEIKNCEHVVRNAYMGSMHGSTVPRMVKSSNLEVDDFHLSCNFEGIGYSSKKLAYLIK